MWQDQYRFLHLILAEAVETGDVAIPVPRFFDSLSTMRSTSGEAGHSAIERQFMVSMISIKTNKCCNMIHYLIANCSLSNLYSTSFDRLYLI